jgi:superfamily I DNA/RNA helicase
VVAIHRAIMLAEWLEQPVGKPVLFTTFTRNLAQAIENDLRALDPGAAGRVDAVNVERMAVALVKEAEGGAPSVALDDYVGKLADDVVAGRGLGDDYSGSFLVNEWEQVVLANDCRSRADYFAVSRAGRGIPLNRRSRAEVWKAIDELEPRTTKPYQHVVVDEAQDLHEAQCRLLRAVVAKAPDDMFIVGDSHQRIYDRRLSLSKVGIKVVGRSAKLKLNYRTTHEIMACSLAMLGTDGGVTADDLDGGSDQHSFAGYHSLRSGPEPVLAGFRTRPEMFDALVGQVRGWIDEGVDPIAIGVAARTNRQVEAAKDALDSAGLTTCLLPQKDLPSKPGVRLGTMHRMKGLEYERVAVSDADDASVLAGWAMTERDDDPVQHASDLELEKSLLYVTATRARDGLYITWSDTPSRFLA